MQSKLFGLEEGEYIGVDVWPVVKGMKRLSEKKEQEMFIDNMRTSIGKGHTVVNTATGKQYVAVLIDVDFETDPKNKRYIFTYYDNKLYEDVTIDTLYDEGWVVLDISE